MSIPSENVAVPDLVQLVDGEQSQPSVDLGIDLENPNTGKVVSRQLATSDADVARAAAAAHREHEGSGWGRAAPARRAAVLEAVADALDAEAGRLAALESLATGAVITTTGMLAAVINGGAFRLAATQLRDGALSRVMDGPTGRPAEVLRLPWGPALCLVPWNAPAPMAAHKVANALAAGAPTILKPSEWAPYGTQELGLVVGRVLAAHDVAPGTFQLVHGGPHTGGALVTDPRVRAVSFTGGLSGGRAIAAACAADFKPAQLELGGNNPILVMGDADTARVAEGVVDLLTQLNGQWCRALGRLLLPASRADELLAAVLERLAGVRLGDSLDPASAMGPIVHSGHLARLRGQVAALEQRGGTAHATTPLPDLTGSFLAPTLVTGVAGQDAVDEIFGPVATVHTYADDREALALANGTPFGLEAYVFAGDTERAMTIAREIRAGGVKVNGSTMLSLNLFAPRPAWGLSGQGDEGTAETLHFFTNHRVVGVEELSAAQLAAFAGGGA